MLVTSILNSAHAHAPAGALVKNRSCIMRFWNFSNYLLPVALWTFNVALKERRDSSNLVRDAVKRNVFIKVGFLV